MGLTLKYLMRDMLLDDASYGKGAGVGYDVGFLIQPMKNFKFGVGLYDLGGTSVSYKDKTVETILPEATKFGVAINPLDNLLLAFDYGDRIHAGAELTIANRLLLRGGIQQETHDEEKFTILSAGTSIKLKNFVFEYGFHC